MPDDVFKLAKKAAVSVDRIFTIGRMAGIGVAFPQFLDEVEAKHRQREIRRLGASMASSDNDDASAWARQLESIAKGASVQAEAEEFGAYDVAPDGDRSILLGDSYLCRGDGLVLSSTSGTGKSSMSMQMAVCWALGMDFFGIKPNGPMRSLVFQTEDGRGDIGKVRRSIFHAMKLTSEEQALVNDRVRIVSKKGMRGQVFLNEARRLIAKYKPDLVWLNPLQAFMDGDLTDGRDLGSFLRGDIDGLNDPPEFGMILVHHTPKPPKGKDKVDLNWNEVMYDMAGGAEIINWARAIMSLRAGDLRGEFNLVLAKRGPEAGVTKASGTAGQFEDIVTTIPVKWSDEMLEIPGRAKKIRVTFWLPRTPSAEEKQKVHGGGRPKAHEFSTYRSAFPKDPAKADRTNVIQRRCSELGGIGKGAFFAMLNQAVEDGLVVKIFRGDEQSPRYHLTVIK
jgi:hypothetical protein